MQTITGDSLSRDMLSFYKDLIGREGQSPADWNEEIIYAKINFITEYKFSPNPQTTPGEDQET